MHANCYNARNRDLHQYRQMTMWPVNCLSALQALHTGQGAPALASYLPFLVATGLCKNMCPVVVGSLCPVVVGSLLLHF